jgi:hypothetical protein
MREYKREKATLETQLHDLEDRSKHHDDHLRTIDAWFDQVSTRHVMTWECTLMDASWSMRSRC